MSDEHERPEHGGSDRPTVVPPEAAAFAARPETHPTPKGTPRAPVNARITLTNEDELERARVASMQQHSTVPHFPAPPYDAAPRNHTVPHFPAPQAEPLATTERRIPAAAPFEPLDVELSAVPDTDPDLDVLPESDRERAAPEEGAPSESSPTAEMRDRFNMGDFAGALQLAEKLMVTSPSDPEPLIVANQCRETLTDLYEARLGSLERVPFVVVARDELRWLSIDHRAGFLLSHIDGVSPLETILDVSGMPRVDALRILVELVQKRIVSLR